MMVRVAKESGEDRACAERRLLPKSLSHGARFTRLASGLRPYWHQRVPPNDGGIALGQVMAAARQLSAEKERGDRCV